MADELTLNASLQYSDSNGVVAGVDIVDLVYSVTTKIVKDFVQSIATTAGGEVIDLGETFTPALAIFLNLDTTNYIELLTGTGGVIFSKLRAAPVSGNPGGFAFLELGSGAQAPFAIANTAACLMRCLVVAL